METNDNNNNLMLYLVIFMVLFCCVLFIIYINSNNSTDTTSTYTDYPLSYTITFDSKGGSYVEPLVVYIGTALKAPTPPTKEGYTFLGWSYDGKYFSFNKSSSIKHDITLVAQWLKKGSTEGVTVQENNSTNNDSNSNNNSNTQTQTENKNTYNVNVRKTQKNNWGNELCALTVMNYQTEEYNSVVGKVEEGQEWVIANMKFENMSDSTIVINKSDFKIVDGAGRYGYQPWYKHLDTELDTIEIRAGQTAMFSVRFVYYKNNEIILRFNHPSIVTEVYTDIKLR